MIPVTVTFYGNVGFDRSYNHVIDFSNEMEREDYFSSRILKVISNCAYNKPMNSIQIRCPYEEALNFSYCKFIIGSNPNSQKKIYAWVDDVVIKTDQKDEGGNYVPILEVNIAVDPWQTFLFTIQVGESFVVREHVDRFRINGDGTRGWCLPNTTDTYSVGATKRVRSLVEFRKEYYTNKVTSELTPSNYTEPPTTETYYKTKVRWIAIQYVRKPTPEETEDKKNYMINLLFPVTPYPICFKRTFNNIDFYVRSLTEKEVVDDTYLTIIGIDPDRVASVVNIPFDVATLSRDGNYNEICDFAGNDISPFIEWSLYFAQFHTPSIIACFVVNFPTTIKYEYTIEDTLDLSVPRDTVYSKSHEPQLYKAPFKQITLVDEFGIEKGVFNDINANVYKVYPTFIEPFKKFTIYLLFDSTEIRLRLVPKGLELNSNYWIEYNLSGVEVIRNAWLSYMLQEREAARSMIQSQINQQAIASAIGGVSGGVSQGGSLAITAGAAAGVAGLGVGLGVGALQTIGGYIANQHFAFEQQDIREKAIKNKANNISQTGNFKSIITEFALYETCCDETTLNLKAQEFHKYGYSVFRYETPDIKSRRYFNFIATNIVKIDGNLNNNIKMAIAEIFNNGVTIWHGDYINELGGIGDYSKENVERSLL